MRVLETPHGTHYDAEDAAKMFGSKKDKRLNLMRAEKSGFAVTYKTNAL
jgi:hypothetical protein